MTEYNHSQLGVIRLQRRIGCKRISICVGRKGRVTVSYPWYVRKQSALDFVEQKVEWIIKAKVKAENRETLQPINNGYQTRTHTLRIEYNQRKSFYKIDDSEVIVGICGEEILSNDAQQLIRIALVETLRVEAQNLIPLMVDVEAIKYGFKYNGITIKNIRSKWASCSATDHLNFSLYIALLPDDLIRFVILHELCHTIHKNHSHEFHALLNSICGGAEKEYNRQLRNYRTSL